MFSTINLFHNLSQLEWRSHNGVLCGVKWSFIYWKKLLHKWPSLACIKLRGNAPLEIRNGFLIFYLTLSTSLVSSLRHCLSLRNVWKLFLIGHIFTAPKISTWIATIKAAKIFIVLSITLIISDNPNKALDKVNFQMKWTFDFYRKASVRRIVFANLKFFLYVKTCELSSSMLYSSYE